MRPRTGIFVLAAAVFTTPSLARADGDPAKLQAAAEEFDEGTKAFKRKDYEAAAAHFEAADRYAPSAAAIGNAIRARKAGKQLARAATLSQLALTRHADDKALAELARGIVAGSEKQLQRVDVSCAPACGLVLDGKVASGEVETYVLFLEPGSHNLVAGWSGDRSRTVRLEATKGGSDSVKLDAPPEPPKPAEPPDEPKPEAKVRPEPAPPPPPPRKPLDPWITYTGAGATALLLGVSIWSGLDTKSSPGTQRVRDACGNRRPDCDSLFDQGKSKELRTNVLFGATAVVGVATGVIAAGFTDWSGPRAPSQGRSISPLIGLSRGAFIGAEGTF